ncbi:hypothetical protein Avbf_18943 [Armadillidium vulgare]|nr:hypothetical protein Avbf_18943 [Armadillidium vulgare]
MSVPLPRPIQRMTLEQISLIRGQFNIFVAYMMGITHLNSHTISEDELKAMVLVICTLESIDSIKPLKRSPQHIFVEVRVPGSGLRTLVHV